MRIVVRLLFLLSVTLQHLTVSSYNRALCHSNYHVKDTDEEESKQTKYTHTYKIVWCHNVDDSFHSGRFNIFPRPIRILNIVFISIFKSNKVVFTKRPLFVVLKRVYGVLSFIFFLFPLLLFWFFFFFFTDGDFRRKDLILEWRY